MIHQNECFSHVYACETNSNELTYKPEGGSGWLAHYTVQRNGLIYPRIVGSEHERGDPNDYPGHWYWQYRYYGADGRIRYRTVPLKKLQKVNYMIAHNKPIQEIIQNL